MRFVLIKFHFCVDKVPVLKLLHANSYESKIYYGQYTASSGHSDNHLSQGDKQINVTNPK